MGVKWDLGMDQRLLLLIISLMNNLSWAKVAVGWEEVYGEEDVQQPTQKAITEHLAKLRRGLKALTKKSGTVTSAPGSSTSKSFPAPPSKRISKKTSPTKSGYKGKGKQKVINTDSDDSEPEADWPEQQVKKEEVDQTKLRLFGEVEPSTRPSLPRTARPEPGAFAMQASADHDEQQYMLNNNFDSDFESDTTVQNTPSNSPTLGPQMQTTPSSTLTPIPWSRSTPISTPTPGPRTRDGQDGSDDDCIVVLSKKASGKE